MKLKIEKIKPNEMSFFISYSIFLVFAILSQSFYYKYFLTVHKYIILFCCLILVFDELHRIKTNKKGLIGLVVCLLMFVITFTVSKGANQNTVPALFLYVYSARNIQFKRIARFTAVFSSLLLLFVIASAYFGMIDDYTITSYGGGGIARIRHYLGFRYALFPSTILFNIICLIIYIRKQSIKKWEILSLFVINYLMYKQTDSRLTFYLAILLIAVAYIMRFANGYLQKRKIILFIGSFCFVIFFGLSMYFTVTYNSASRAMYELNLFLGNRLRLGKTSLALYGISMFPNGNVEWIGAGLDAFGNRSTLAYSYVDSLYIQALQHYGVVFMIVFLSIMTLLMLQIRNRDIYLYVIIFSIAAHYAIDDLQLYLHYNTFWLALGYVLIGSMSEIRVKRKTSRKINSKHRRLNKSLLRSI